MLAIITSILFALSCVPIVFGFTFGNGAGGFRMTKQSWIYLGVIVLISVVLAVVYYFRDTISKWFTGMGIMSAASVKQSAGKVGTMVHTS